MTKTNQLTAETITTAQIRRLRTEAMEAGDSLQVEVCDLALDPSTSGAWSTEPSARQACADAINAARAQEEV